MIPMTKMGERMTYRGKRKSHRGLNTRNVRNSTLKQKEKNKLVEKFKSELDTVATSLAQRWVELPSFNRKCISILFLLWLGVIIWSPEDETENKGEKSREVTILPIRKTDNRPLSDMDLGLVDTKLTPSSRVYDEAYYDEPEIALTFADEDDNFRPKSYRKVSMNEPRDLQTGMTYHENEDEVRPLNRGVRKETNKEVNIVPLNEIKYVEQAESQASSSSASRDLSPSASSKWRDYRIVRGDNMSKVFRKNKFKLSDLYVILAIEGKDKPLTLLQPDQTVRFLVSNKGQLDALEIEVIGKKTVTFRRNTKGKFDRVS